MNGTVFGGNLNPGDGTLDFTNGAGCAGDGHLLRFMGKESGHVGHCHGSQVILETCVDILCEMRGRSGSDKEGEEGSGCVLRTRNMILDVGSRDGVEVGEWSTVGGVDMF